MTGPERAVRALARLREPIASARTEAIRFVAASVVAGAGQWLFDVATWPIARRPASIAASLVLGIAHGAAIGLGIFFAVWMPIRCSRRARLVRRVMPYIAPALVAALAARQALSITSGSRDRVVVVAAMGVIGIVSVLVLGGGLAALAKPDRLATRARGWSVLALSGLGLALLLAERGSLRSASEATFSFVEGLAHLAWTLALALVFWWQERARLVSSLAFSAIGWLAVFALSRPVRGVIERALPAVWEEPVYASKWLRRSRALPTLGAERADTHRLVAKYELSATTPDVDRWSPARLDPGESRLRDGEPWNVVVYFVDALRADIAHDNEVMPATNAWMTEQAIHFSRAYATGSSTLLTLVPMLGCRYDANAAERPMLLDVARRAGVTSALAIPRAAADYHRVAFSGFTFDHEDVVPDVDGRRIATAESVVDRSLAWLRDARPEPFLLWLYQFDVHGWSDLDEGYVERQAKEGHLSKTDGLPWRYRAAARGVDQAFARLRRGLEELGLAERTIVLFVADHGEALGQRDFWAHSTYLWESLIRVPLALQVPGEAARTIDEPVSTIDVSTTLVPFVEPGASTSTCHGVDLLRVEDAPFRKRQEPILFSAMINGPLAKIGILGRPDRKLVLDLRDTNARLLRIDGSSDERDVSADEPDEFRLRLGQLLRSPIYPRP